MNIDEVNNVERLDEIDRKKLRARTKLKLLCEEAKIKYGRDPRGGGFRIVARPRVVLQMLVDLGDELGMIKLGKPIIIGTTDADVVGEYENIPIIVRSTVTSDAVFCLQINEIPESSMIDRRRAGELRIHAHAGTLERLRED